MKKKTKKPVSRNKIRNGQRARLEGVVASLRKNRNDLKDKIRQQTDELKSTGNNWYGAMFTIRAPPCWGAFRGMQGCSVMPVTWR